MYQLINDYKYNQNKIEKPKLKTKQLFYLGVKLNELTAWNLLEKKSTNCTNVVIVSEKNHELTQLPALA